MREKRSVLLRLGVVLALTTGVFHSAHAQQLNRPAPGVTSVHFDLPAQLSVRAGIDERITVDADPRVLDKIEIVQRGPLLVLSSKGSFSVSKPIKISLTVKTLQHLRSTSSGMTTIDGLAGDDLAIEAAGSGDVAMRAMKYERVLLDLPGSGTLSITGSGRSVRARLNGSGVIDASGFTARNVQASLDGSGDIQVNATESLTAGIGGAGRIGYVGRPRVSQSISGAGSVEKL